MKHTKEQKADAIHILKEWLPEGSTVHTILRHVSTSGMLRRIDLYRFIVKDDGEVGYLWLTGQAAIALDYKRDPNKDGLIVHGCGMDMGFKVVYELSRLLYGDGYVLNHHWL